MTRPAATSNSLFYNALPRPALSSRTAPRLVENKLSVGYKIYKKGGGSSWGDFPTDTSSLTWGGNEDGGQWVEATTTSGGVERVWASFTFAAKAGQKHIVSFNIDSVTGAQGGNNVLASGTALTGTATLAVGTVGRHAIVFTSPTDQNVTVRFGIGTASNSGSNSTIRYSNILWELPSDQTRDVPYEYVTPGDQRVFPYTYSATRSTTAISVPVKGDSYPIPTRSSVLVIGDSFTNDVPNPPTSYGDFPYHIRRFLEGKPIAVNQRGVSGANVLAITDQITNALAETDYTLGAAPYSICLIEGGVNDLGSTTLAQMKVNRLAQIAAAISAGMYPVIMTIAPYDAASAAQQTQMDAFNAWTKTLGYPVYDLFSDATDGSSDFKTSWGSGDGVHPGQSWTDGSAIMGQRLADLLMLIGDK